MYKVLAALVVVLSSFLDASALRVVPFVHSFDPDDKKESNFQYYVENKTDDYMAFEISVYRRRQNEKGEDILEKDNQSFFIAPTQIIIPPHSHRSVKTKWRENEEFKNNRDKEQAFRVVMTQFPIDINKKKEKHGAQLEITYEIKTSLYMTPKTSEEKLKVVKEDANVIVLKNEGTRRSTIRTSNFKINNVKIADLIDKDEVQSVILPGNTRAYHKAKKTAEKKEIASKSK